MKRFLLIGSSGQVGWELIRTLMPLGQVIIADRTRYDMAKPELLVSLVDAARPDVIVNAAAYTAVDKAEQESDLAMTVNARAPGVLARAARDAGALMVHYSSDYVFDGRKREPYLEDDTPNPQSAYGRSKLAGDEALRASGADHLIFRTSWVYAARGKNFMKTILRLAGEREELRVVSDQVGAPTWARLIAEVTAHALKHDLAHRDTGGFASATLNLSAAGETSWHGFACAAIAAARGHGVELKCRQVVPIATTEYPLPAVRPAYSRLSTAKLAARYGLAMPEWEIGMRLCLDEMQVNGEW